LQFSAWLKALPESLFFLRLIMIAPFVDGTASFAWPTPLSARTAGMATPAHGAQVGEIVRAAGLGLEDVIDLGGPADHMSW
jgi:hypothetical protein